MLAGKRATSGPIAGSEARSATIAMRGGSLAHCVGSPEVVQEVVVKTGRSLPVGVYGVTQRGAGTGGFVAR
jgi:hypothetical protein